MTTDTPVQGFDALGLSDPILQALQEVGYETPSPIQAQIIPHVLEGKDVLGQAQTGTGKTAAFALPLLSNIDLKRRETQVLVLAPTRELAIQVSEAFQKYASKMKGFHVLPIYGGQAYTGQLRGLKRGAQVVVGTPGRVVDHIKRGTLKLETLDCLVLDEADEMLRMGFIDDVEWVLSQTPEERQVALFSATMPPVIRRIAKKHLNSPEEVTIKSQTSTVSNTRQRVWQVSGMHKLDALTRILEGEDYDGVIVFARTKLGTVELADRLAARGHEAVAINGDMDQRLRERTIEQFKAGALDILVATDVVARGIDVDRVSHVVNYDIPYDTESYVHRIGRTGRAGRKGEAILFVAPRERRLLNAIERATKQKIEKMELPSVQAINDKRIASFKQKLIDALAPDEELAFYQQLVAGIEAEQELSALDMAAAMAKLMHADKPLLLKQRSKKAERDKPARDDRRDERPSRDRRSRDERPPRDRSSQDRPKKPAKSSEGLENYRIEVGHDDHVEPGNIVGAIANEAGLDSEYIGHIEIHDSYSFVELPEGMPKSIYRDLKKVWVAGKQLKIQRVDENRETVSKERPRSAAAGHKKKPRSQVRKGGANKSVGGHSKKRKPKE